MKSRAIVIAIIVTGLAGAAVASGSHGRSMGMDVREIVRKVKATYDATKSAEVRFEQTSRTGVATGSVAFSGEDRYRIDIGQRSIVSDGKVVWSFTPERNQVVISKAGSARGGVTPKDILTRFPGSYSTTLLGESKIGRRGVYIVRCTAAGEKIGDITVATLYIDQSTYRFHRIELESPSLGAVTVRVLSAKYNVILPDARYVFRPPVGARVIDLRR